VLSQLCSSDMFHLSIREETAGRITYRRTAKVCICGFYQNVIATSFMALVNLAECLIETRMARRHVHGSGRLERSRPLPMLASPPTVSVVLRIYIIR